MKRMLLALAAALAISANAAVSWEKVGGVQVVDTAGLTSAVMKFGEMSGNAMVGAMLAAKIMDLPSNGFFGPMRQGGSLYFPLYVDADKLAEADDAEGVGNAVEYAVVYPMALPKDEFINLHPGAVETNGMLLVEGEMFLPESEWDEDSQVYVAFSEDGKWAAASDRPEQVVQAVGDFALAARPMDGDVVRVEVLPRCIAAFCRVLESQPNAKELMSGLDGVSVALRIGDRGIDLHGFARTSEGSLMSKFGEVSLPEDPFAFDEGEAVSAVANSFEDQSDVAGDIRKLFDILKANGLDAAQFVSLTENDGACRFVVDVPAAVGYFSNPSNSMDKVDFEKIGDSLDDDSEPLDLKPATRANSISLSFKDFKPKYSASQRFASIMPELKGRPLCYASTCSLCAIIQASLQTALAAIDDRQRNEVAPMVSLFPKECEGGFATAYWRDGDKVRFLWRASGDELRSVTTGASAIFMYAMMRENERRCGDIDDQCGEDCAFCEDDACDDFDDDEDGDDGDED